MDVLNFYFFAIISLINANFIVAQEPNEVKGSSFKKDLDNSITVASTPTQLIKSILPLPDPNVITRAIIEGALSQHEYQREPKIEGKAYSTFQERSNSDNEKAVTEQARKLIHFFKPTYAVYPNKPADIGTNGNIPNKVIDNLHTSSSTSSSSAFSTNISSSQIGANVSGGSSSTVSSTPVSVNPHVASNGNQINKPGIAAGFFHNFLSAFNSDNKQPAGTTGLTGLLANAVSGLGNSQNGIGSNTSSTGFLGNLAGFAGSALGNAITGYHNQHSHGVTSQMIQKPPNNNVSPNNLNNYQSTQQLYNTQSNVNSQLFNGNPINLPAYQSLGNQGAINFNTGSFTNNNGFSSRPNPFYFNSRPTDFQNSGYFGPLNNNVGPDSGNQGWFTNRWPENRPNLSNNKIVSASYFVRPPNTNYIGPRPQIGGLQNGNPSDYQTMTNEGFNGVSSQANIVNSIGSLLNLNKVGVGLIDQSQENSLNRIIIAHHGIRKAPFYAGLIYTRPLEVSNAIQATNALLAAAGGYNAGYIPVIIGMGGDGTATVLDNIKFPSSTNAMETSQGNHLGYEINSNQRPNNNVVNYNAQYFSNLGSTTNPFLNSQTQGGLTSSDKLPNINSQVQIGEPSSNINSLVNGMKFPQGGNVPTLLNEGTQQTFTNNIQPSNNNFSTNSQSNTNTFLQSGNLMSSSNNFNAFNGNLLIQPQKYGNSISNNQGGGSAGLISGSFSGTNAGGSSSSTVNNANSANLLTQGNNILNQYNNAQSNTNSFMNGGSSTGSINSANSQSNVNAFSQGGNVNQYSGANAQSNANSLSQINSIGSLNSPNSQPNVNTNSQINTNSVSQGNNFINQFNNANAQSNTNSLIQGGSSIGSINNSANSQSNANAFSQGGNPNQYSGANAQSNANAYLQGSNSVGSLNSANSQSNANTFSLGGNLNLYSGANAQSNANAYLQGSNSVDSLNSANSQSNANAFTQGGNSNQYSGANAQSNANAYYQGSNSVGSLNSANSQSNANAFTQGGNSNQYSGANAQSNANAYSQGSNSVGSLNSANSQSNANAFSLGGNLNLYSGANAQSNANAYSQGSNSVGSMNSANSQYNANRFPPGGYGINQYGITNSGGSSSNTFTNANSQSNANTMSQGNNGFLQAQLQGTLPGPNIAGPTNKPLLSVKVPFLSPSSINPFQKNANVKKSDIEIAKESGEALAGAFKSFLKDNVLY